MGKTISAAILALGFALATPLAAFAAGLGKLTVLSPLGQPLNAEVEIVALRPGEEDTLVARVAPPEAFSAAGIEPGAVLNTMRFTIERRGAQRILRMTTTQPVNDPFVEVLVELQSGTGRLVREYTFLLDPPEYKARDALAAPPKPKPAAPKPAAATPESEKPAAAPPPLVQETKAEPKEAKPTPPVVAAAPMTPEPPKEEAAKVQAMPLEEPAKPLEEPAKPSATEEPSIYEVQKGDTLAQIAQANLAGGVTLNQMLVAIYRANQDAFLRENVNWVRAGAILNMPSAEAVGTVDSAEANRIVRANMQEFRDYRSRLAASPAVVESAAGQPETTGQIEPKPEAPKPAAPQDQVRLSKVDPQKPAGAAAARGDDAVARERALKEAQSRIGDLEKNVADLQKLLELKNQQLAELERKAAGAQPTPAAPTPPPAPAPTAAETPKPAAAAEPAPAVKPAAKPVAAKPAPPPAPEPSLLDEFLENPVALGGLALVVLLLLVYALVSYRKKKSAQARFQDSVMDAAAAGPTMNEPTLRATTPVLGQTVASAPPPGMAAEEVDPIAEADVYMAYGRDAQAEEILKEALQKDSRRVAVHAKLLEIYAKRKDMRAFEQTALKVKNLTHGSGPEWDKAAALGKSIDPSNGFYAGAAGAAAGAYVAQAAAEAPPAPALDFDVGSATQPVSLPDLALDVPKPEDTGIDFDVSSAPAKADTGLDFNLDDNPAPPAPLAAPDLTLDLNLDAGSPNKAEAGAAPDLSTISLDLGAPEPSAPPAGSDPKWQEIATKLDLAKAYEEMGDKDGARELLGEVIKDGDSAQKGQAQQLLEKLA